MSASVTQLVLHPAVTSSLKVTSTTVGRDKIYRTVQYFARFLSWYCLRKGYSNETVAKLNALKSTLGLSRKLMRIGKPVEHLQAAVKAVDVADPFVKFTAIGRQLGYAGYLVNDMIIWAHSAKVYPLAPETQKKIANRAARLWFTGLVFSLVSGAYKLRDIQAKEVSLRRVGPSEKEGERRSSLKALQTQKAAVKYQAIQDSLDILIPSSSLGYHSLDEGIIGIAGTISSIMGLRTQITKVLGK